MAVVGDVHADCDVGSDMTQRRATLEVTADDGLRAVAMGVAALATHAISRRGRLIRGERVE